MKRALCLYIPFLSTDRRRRPDNAQGAMAKRKRGHVVLEGSRVPHPSRSEGWGTDAPVATITSQGRVLRIVHANRRAHTLDIRPGQTLAEAKAIVPDLVTCDDDPAADRRQLKSLAVWAGAFSPIVHLEDENTLIVDVTGCERLFDGEPNLLSRAIEGLQAQGFTARGAIADTLGAAWAIAHAHGDPAVIAPPGQTAAQLISLPVWSLRIDPKTTRALALVGVETIASLLHLPRSSLTSRFGPSLLDRLDQALGDLPEALNPYRPHPVMTSRFHLGTATTRIDVLTEAIRRALNRFCDRLAKRVAGVRQMFITFYCPDVMTDHGPQTRTVTLDVNLSQPTRSPEHLFSLLTVLIDQLRLPAPADALTLWARETDPLDDWQDELFATDASDARELGDLLDRLVVRLSPEAVVRPQLLSEHQPERAFRYLPLVAATKTSKRATNSSQRTAGFNPRGHSNPDQRAAGGTCPDVVGSLRGDPRGSKPAAHPHGITSEPEFPPAGPRPLRLMPHPIEIAATAVVPEGPPIAFKLRGTLHPVVKSVGPERIETGWWRGPHLQRDYYRVLTKAGRHGWIFRERDTGRWFLHGWFD